MLRLLIFLVMSIGVVTGVTAQDSKPEKYKSGDDDGFTKSGINFAVSVYGQEEVCTESVMTMGVVVQGMESYTYQWFKDGSPITGAKNTEYEIADVKLGDAGTYRCEVTDFAGRSTVTSSDLKLKVSISPKITLNASKVKIASGDSCLLWVTGEPGTTYQWSTLQSKDSIWVKPRQNTRYYVVGKNGNICDITKYVDIEVVDLYVKPCLDQYITKSGTVRLTAQSNVTDIKWYAKPLAMSAIAWKALASGEDYGELIGEDSSIVVTPSVSTLYTAVASLNGYSVNRSTTVHIKGAQSFVGGMDAGFSRTGINFSVNVSVTPNPVCENVRSVFKASVNGVEGYKYAWFKLQDGQPDLLMAESDSFFFNKTALSDSGDYFCRISDLVGKDTLVSDVLHLTVNALPVASIVPDGDTTICLSDTLLLRGYSSVAGAGFSWRGNSAVDPLNSQNIRVVPTDSAQYILTTSLNGCATNDTVDVSVNRALVNVPYSMNATKGNPITITAKNAEGSLISGNSLSWFQDGIKSLGNGNPKLISDVEEDMVIRAAFDTGKCTYSDYTHVYVKGRETFNGGIAQGFNRTAVNFNVTVGVTPNPVCEGIGVQFAAVVNGLENYTYKWFKLRDGSTDSLVGQQDSFLIPRTSMSDSGFYFCQIVDAMGKDTVVSDTLKLGVLHSVIAEIAGSRDTVMCVNDTIELKGTTSLAGTTFTWGGANIVGRWDSACVQVAPTGKTDYILYPNVTGCAVNDTITVHINKAFVDIPAIVNVGEGGSVELTALNGGGVIGDGSKLNWWRDTVNDLGHGNPKIIPSIMKDMAITVTYDTGTCQFVDYARIYVKGIDAYRGGVDEGYSRTAVNFKLEVEVNPNPVCENWRSVFYANVIGVEEYSYRWFKLREGQADSLVAQADSFVFEQTALSDSGLYFCEVTDTQGKDTLLSDTLKLVVNPSPIASIVPLADTVICLGDTLLLEGHSTVADVNYSWRGADILDLLTNQNIRVLPRDSAQYILTVNGNGCTSADTINVSVNKAAVKVPYSINGVKDKPIVITARDANDNRVNGNNLTWTRDDVSDLGNGNPKQITLVDQDMVIRVEYDTANCIFEGYTRIYVKDNNTFNGGLDDGFDRTAVNFKVDVKVNPNPVCEAIGTLFAATVTGTDEYTYQWFKLREGTTDSLVSRRDSFMISRTALSDSGYYFCQVSDVMGKDTVLSDTLKLNVASSVIASILGGRDTSICVNDTLVLEGVVSLSGAALVWSGTNIVGSWDSSIVIVAPTEKTDYVLATNFAGCSVNDTITVDINRAFVKIPPIINILENAELEITAEDANGAIKDGGKLTWWRDTVNNLGHGNPKKVPSDRDMFITVFYDTVGCVFTDESRIYVRGLDAFAGGDDDGFDRSIINFNVKVEANPNPVCENVASFIYATVNGPEEYQYVWFKLRDGQSDSLINRSDSIYFEKTSLADSGFYFCQIQDTQGRVALNSDTVHFRVHAIPVAMIKPQGDTLICMSDTLTLYGNSDVAGVAYSWMGNDILDPLTSQNIRVAPSDTADYVLRVDNHGCVATDTIRVYINRASVRLPYSVNAIKGSDVVLTAKDENNNPIQGGTLTWTRDDVSDLGNGNPMSVLAVDQDMVIMVAYDTAKCIYRDYTHIYVKDDNTFNGGIDDGFDRTAVNFKVDVTVDPNPVCEKVGSVFAAAVTGLDGYDFKWFKLREGLADSLMAEKDTFMIPRTELSDSGYYFCQVTDVMGKDTVISDTLKLRVISSVYTTILGSRDTIVCLNDTATLEGFASEAGTELIWSGNNILGRWDTSIIQIAPTEKTDYILTAIYAGCAVSDTITVDVNRAIVKIPPVIYTLRDAELEITAKDENGTIANGDKLTWWRDNVNDLGHGNPKKIVPVDTDMLITVVYDTATCPLVAHSNVYIRNGVGVFDGGYDDGFARNAITFGLEVLARPNPVCEDMASVLIARTSGLEEYTYQWFKIRDGKADTMMIAKDSLVFDKTELSDSGRYYCQITEERSKEKVNSDTIYFDVRAKVIASILPDVDVDTVRCMNDTLVLEGVSSIDGAVFSWRGEEILDSLTSQNIRIVPVERTTYILTVNNDGCAANDTIVVDVNRSFVKVPYSINAVAGSSVEITAVDENGDVITDINKLTWWRDSIIPLASANPQIINPADKNMIVRVEYENRGCITFDDTRIYIKDSASYNGGEDDGFAGSVINFGVDIEIKPDTVCEGGEVEFIASVNGESDYTYKWWKINNPDSLMSDSSYFKIEHTVLCDSGLYFCAVTDKNGNFTIHSDTQRLVVYYPLIADIIVPDGRDTSVNEGASLIVEASVNAEVDTVVWFISKQDGTFERKPLTGELVLNNIDVTYDSCSVWFEVSNSCGTVSSDTVMIWVGLQLRVSPSVSFICPDDSAMIVVELLKGANPWSYHYRAPLAMTDSIVTNIAGQTDTLYVKQKGTYQITYVEDADGVTRTKNLPEFKVNMFNTTVKFSGGGEVCKGDSDTVLIEVKNGVGPWNIEIRTVSENELAYILMGGNGTLQISDSIVKIGFMPSKSEGYYISLIEDLHHDEFICLGTPDKDTVTVKVNNPGKVLLKGDRRYGQCNDINIRTTLTPRLDGVICRGGNFNLDGEWMSASVWKTEDLTAGTHKIMFQDTVGGCKVKSDTIDLYIDTLSAALSLDHFHCKSSGVVDNLLVEVSGMGNFSFDLTQIRIGKNGPYMTQTNPKTIQSEADTVVTLNYMEAIGWMDSDVAVVYRVTNVTDGYGCPWAIDKLQDTIIAMPKPTLKIESRTPDENTSPWKVRGDDDFYTIPKGQLVGVKATLTGTPQWKLLIDRNNQPYRSIAGITGQDTTFALDQSGEYKFRVANDKYCTNYDDPKYVGVSYLDTGYIRLKAMLEGPFSSAAGNRMVSAIPASSIPLYGIPHLPVVPGKKVIDWIEVELRTGSPIDSVARMGEGAVLFVKDTCLLLDDGTVVDRWGSDTIALRYAYGEESKIHHYYVVLRHRNHLSVMTKKEFKVTNKRSEAELVDFRDSMNLYHSQNTKLEDHMKYVTDGRKEIWMMCAGEVNDNKLISIYDPNSVTTHNNGLKGYYLEDVNFDGEIDLTRGFGGALDGRDWRIVKKNRNRYTEILFKQMVPTK